MEIKLRTESDGICFGKSFQGCLILKTLQKGCNTYRCPFYKPCGCEDWIRFDKPNLIVMLPPEETEVRNEAWL